MSDFHSRTGVAAYHDLLRLLKDDSVTDLRGAPAPKTVSGKDFWYDRFRLGERIVWHYLGPDSDEMRARIARLNEIRDQRKERRKAMARLAAVLRAEGYATFDVQTGQLLAAMERAGVFRLGGTVVGTVAFRLYEGDLGLRIGFDDLAQTGDLDIASFERLSLAIGDEVTEPTDEVLSALRFDPVPSLRPGAVWRWRDTKGDAMVEFLTPAFGEEGIRDLKALGVSAQGLHHLNFLIANPIKAVALYRSGVLVQVPRPEAYAIHKLIVADRQQGGAEELKSRKDRAQAALLIEALAEVRPDELLEAYEDALARGPKWRQRIEASLKRMPEAARRLADLG